MHLSLMSVKLRREIFRALVEVQDRGESVAHSRDIIAKRFELTRKQVRSIEDEGIDHEWPPLSELIAETAEVSEDEDELNEDESDAPKISDSENHAA